MFRKPKSRNIRVRQSNQEDAAESTDDVPTVSAPSAAAIPKNILSFDQDEGDDVGTFQIRRIESRNEHKLRRHKKFMEKHVKGETKIIGDHEEVIIKQEEDDISVIEEIEPAEKVNFQESSKNGYNDEEDVRQRFPSSFSEIPDAKAIYEARKRRELMRGSVQPVIPIENPVEDKHAQRSRLIREDENDLSDEENPESTYISSRNLLIDEEQQRRNEQLEALKLEQGDSDEEDAEKNLSDDEEMERWEREQISKGVGRKKVNEMRQEIASHREHFYNQRNVAPLNRDRIMVEDMDIEVDYSEKSANRVPSFLNASDGTMKRAKKYETMAQLIDKLKNGIISRREELNTKRYQIDQYAGYIATNKESISLLAEGNIKMERNFQLYQEMRFSSDNVMNCLNEKILTINEIESAIFEVWQTRANDLARRRADERKRRKFERQRPGEGWNSDAEESIESETYLESVGRLHERASTIFEDTATEYCDIALIIRRFMDWFQTDPKSFRDAYIAECIPKVVGPFVRIELFDWNPLLPRNKPLHKMLWYQAVLRLGFNNEGIDVDDPAISGLIPDIVEKIILPKMTKIVNEQWDPLSVTQTSRLVGQIEKFVSVYSNLTKDSRFFVRLLNAIRQKAQLALKHESDIPAHLTSVVTEIRRERPVGRSNKSDDIQALLAQSQSILK